MDGATPFDGVAPFAGVATFDGGAAFDGAAFAGAVAAFPAGGFTPAAEPFAGAAFDAPFAGGAAFDGAAFDVAFDGTLFPATPFGAAAFVVLFSEFGETLTGVLPAGFTGRDDVLAAFVGADFRTACFATFFAGALAVFFAAPFVGAADFFAGAFFAAVLPLPAEAGAGLDAFFTVVLRTVFVDFFAVRETFVDLDFVFDLAFEAIVYLRTYQLQHAPAVYGRGGFAAQR